MKIFIKEAREQAGFSQRELAERIGVAPNTLHGYESGKHDPKSDLLVQIAAACQVSVDFLLGVPDIKNAPSVSDEAFQVARQYEGLDLRGKGAVKLLLDYERQAPAQAAPAPVQSRPPKVIPLFGNSFAAGAPEPDFGNQWEDYEVPADSKADFAIHINGDSMEPYLPDGSIALGRRGQPEDGGVGAFLLDGEYLCKQFCQDHVGNIYLFSLNRARKDADVTVWHDSGRTLLCFGRILLDKPVPLPGNE